MKPVEAERMYARMLLVMQESPIANAITYIYKLLTRIKSKIKSQFVKSSDKQYRFP